MPTINLRKYPQWKQTPAKITLSIFYTVFFVIWIGKHCVDSCKFEISRLLKKEILYATHTLWGNVHVRKLTFCYLLLLGWEYYHWVHKQNSDQLKQIKTHNNKVIRNDKNLSWETRKKKKRGKEKISQPFQNIRDAMYSVSQLMKAKCYLCMSLLKFSSKINVYIFI